LADGNFDQGVFDYYFCGSDFDDLAIMNQVSRVFSKPEFCLSGDAGQEESFSINAKFSDLPQFDVIFSTNFFAD